MRTPSLKVLEAHFPQAPRPVLEAFKAHAAKSVNWRTTAHKADATIAGHGVETIRCPKRGLVAVYVNPGDTYSPTLLLRFGGGPYATWCVTTLGDFVEAFERRHGRAASEALSTY